MLRVAVGAPGRHAVRGRRDGVGLHQPGPVVEPHANRRVDGVGPARLREHAQESVPARHQRNFVGERLHALGEIQAADPEVERGSPPGGVGDGHCAVAPAATVTGRRGWRIGRSPAVHARGAHRVLTRSEIVQRAGGRHRLAEAARARHRHRGIHAGRQTADRHAEASGGRRAPHGELQLRRLSRGDVTPTGFGPSTAQLAARPASETWCDPGVRPSMVRVAFTPIATGAPASTLTV